MQYSTRLYESRHLAYESGLLVSESGFFVYEAGFLVYSSGWFTSTPQKIITRHAVLSSKSEK